LKPFTIDPPPVLQSAVSSQHCAYRLPRTSVARTLRRALAISTPFIMVKFWIRKEHNSVFLVLLNSVHVKERKTCANTEVWGRSRELIDKCFIHSGNVF